MHQQHMCIDFSSTLGILLFYLFIFGFKFVTGCAERVNSRSNILTECIQTVDMLTTKFSLQKKQLGGFSYRSRLPSLYS